MITLPDIRSVPLSIPLIDICNISDDIKRVTSQINGLNKALCSRPAGRPALPIMEATQQIAGQLKGTIEDLIANEEHVNPLIERYNEDRGLSVEYGTYYSFFGNQASNPITAIVLQIETVYELDASFLKDLKRHRPQLYPLIRIVLATVASFWNVTTSTEICSMMEDRIQEDILDAEDDETKQDLKKRLRQIKAEEREFRKHLLHARTDPCNALKKMEELYRATSHLMSQEESLFVMTAIAATEAAIGWDPRMTDASADYDNYYDEGDRHHITSFFYLTWGDGICADFMEDFLNGSGELQAPQVILKIKDRKSLESAKQAVRYIVLLQTLMAAGNRIWT